MSRNVIRHETTQRHMRYEGAHCAIACCFAIRLPRRCPSADGAENQHHHSIMISNFSCTRGLRCASRVALLVVRGLQIHRLGGIVRCASGSSFSVPRFSLRAQRSKDPADYAAVLESHMIGLRRSCALGFRLCRHVWNTARVVSSG